jgi:DNA-directed RNA polymerase specialized sigma24 family protein
LPEPLTPKEQAAFQAAWAGLSMMQRTVIYYARVERMPYAEIATSIYDGRVTESVLRQTVSRAARKFRSTYEAKLNA